MHNMVNKSVNFFWTVRGATNSYYLQIQRDTFASIYRWAGGGWGVTGGSE